jgi:hypothetical protein
MREQEEKEEREEKEETDWSHHQVEFMELLNKLQVLYSYNTVS